MTLLQHFFYGNLDPNTDCYDSDSEYGEATKTIDDREARLNALLGEPEKALFRDLLDAENATNAITAEEKFLLGFRMGARLMLEILDDRAPLGLIDG